MTEIDAHSPIESTSHFSVGDEIEARREQLGFNGAWYEATIVKPSFNSANNKRRRQYGYWVEYKYLSNNQPDEDGEFRPLREYIRKVSLLRPKPPCNEGLSFEENDVVDVYHLDGWWTGGVVGVVGEAKTYRVALKDTNEVIEFSQVNVRLHVDWVNGNWAVPIRGLTIEKLQPNCTLQENDESSPIDDSFFRVGDEVEAKREQPGFTGAWYEATIVKSSVESLTSKKKKWGFWVEYKHLLNNQPDKGGELRPLREYIRKISLLRPKPPSSRTTKQLQDLCFEEKDVVDAYHLAGWWVGVIARVVDKGFTYRVAFRNPDEELEVSHLNLRFHLDWVGGNWIRPILPHKKMDLELVNSSAAEDRFIKETGSSKKKLGSSESSSDVVHTRKKLKTRKTVVGCNSRGDNDEKGGCERSTENPSDHRPLEETQGVDKQVVESTICASVNEQNEANQDDLASTDGVNTSAAGPSTAVVQPSIVTSVQQPNGFPDFESNSITSPDQSLSLPFKKTSNIWRVVESMEVFTKYPQNPHFSPLSQYEEKKREELAVQKMITYAFVVEKIADLNSSTDVEDIHESLDDLEEYGFNVVLIRHRLNYQTQLRNQLEELEDRVKGCKLDLEEADDEIRKIDTKLKDLENKRMSAQNVRDSIDRDIMELESKKTAIYDHFHRIQLDFNAKQSFF